MTRFPFMTAFAAVTMITGGGAFSATAADFGGAESGYERGYSQDYRGRVPDNYDEDDRRDRRPGRESYGGWHNGGWQGRPNGGWHAPGYIQRVEARAGYSSDYLPYNVKQWRARQSAIDAWNAKVARLYGGQFANWRTAESKLVNCDAGAGSIYCTVSARPVRGWGRGRWGWNLNR